MKRVGPHQGAPGSRPGRRRRPAGSAGRCHPESTITGESARLGARGGELAGRVGRTVSAAAVPATIAVCLVRAWMMRLVRAAWRRAACFLRPASMRALPAFLSAAGTVPAPRPRFVSVVRLAWWDGVSHVVTRPGSRARHSTREHVPLADVLAGQVTCSAVTRRSRGPRRPAPLRPGRRDVHFALENEGRTAVVQRNASGPRRRAPP